MPAATQHPLSFDQALEGYLRAHGQLTFLRIGGDDGAGSDPLRKHILAGNASGVTVAPADFGKLQARHGLQQIDLLQIDAGRDGYELLKGFDFQRFRPALVHYNSRHLDPQDRAAAEELLRAHGYVLNGSGQDTLALRGILIQNQAADVTPLLGIANTLLNERRNDLASELYKYVLQTDPDNVLATVNAAVAAMRREHHAEAVRLIGRARGMASAGINIVPYVEEIRARAAQMFNELVAKNEIVAAESIIDALAEVNPEIYLTSALSIARNLARSEKAVVYARRILESDPLSWPAHAALYTDADQRGDIAGRLFHVSQAAMSRLKDPNYNASVVSRAARSAISSILTNPTHPEFVPVIDELRAAVAARPQEFDNEEDRAADRFIRVSLDTVDTTIFQLPLSEDAPPSPALTFADTAGKVLEAEDWRRRLLAGTPKVAFLAAADEVYLRRYGANYLNSLLIRCDVDCAIILCMVGDPKNLKSVIQEIGIQDPRVFYMVDTYDPANGVSVYTTKGCRENASNTYYQSVRFLVLGHLLHMLNLPLIVSDIDLMLQGSIAGMLDGHADSDVVLNRNDIHISYGSQFTANLLLVRPGATGRQFARILRVFLERALKHDHIEMFIDQVALVFAHYYCHQHGLDRFGIFGDKDINNAMFNETDMSDEVISLAKTFVFFAYYGSQGESAVELMNRIAGRA